MGSPVAAPGSHWPCTVGGPDRGDKLVRELSATSFGFENLQNARISRNGLQERPQILSTDVYTWGRGSIEFHRCRNCSCVSHWAAVDRKRSRIGVNARLMHLKILAGVSRTPPRWRRHQSLHRLTISGGAIDLVSHSRKAAQETVVAYGAKGLVGRVVRSR